MSFAVVELKYMPKKTFVVPICWVKNCTPNFPSTQEFYCFISTDLKDAPNFQCKYFMKFNGTPGLFKVFVLTVTDSLIDAVSYQEKKRIKSVPKKFRQPANTEAELNSENAKRKKKNNMITKAAKDSAKTINMAHLASVFTNIPNLNVPSVTQNSDHDHITAQANVPENTQQNHVHRTGIDTQNLPIELTPTVSNNFSNIVREALDLDTLENDDLLNGHNLNLTEQDALLLGNLLNVETKNTDSYHVDNNESPQVIHIDNNENPQVIHIVDNEIPKVIYIENIESPQVIHIENVRTTSNFLLSNAASSDGMHMQQLMGETSDSLIKTPTPCISTASAWLNQLNCCGKENTISKQGIAVSTDGFDYKDAYFQQKEKNAELEERNLSLQKALVAANKALAKSKVPEVPFTKQDGGRLYSEGVFLNATQCKILDGTLDHHKYVNNLALAIFGRDTLKNSSVTGTASKKHAGPAKPPLNPLWLQLLYDLTDARTNKSLSKSNINVILNKKMSNFNGADNRKLDKIARDAREKVVSETRAESARGVATME